MHNGSHTILVCYSCCYLSYKQRVNCIFKPKGDWQVSDEFWGLLPKVPSKVKVQSISSPGFRGEMALIYSQKLPSCYYAY